MKRLTSILLALVMVISLVGCGNSADTEETETSSEAVETAEEGTPEETEEAASEGADGEEGKPKIGLSIAGLTMPYFVRMYEGFLAAAEKEGYEVVFADGGADAESTVKAVEDLLSNDIDALAVSTNYSEALADTFATCKEEGIPIFYIGNLSLVPEVQESMTFWEGTRNDSAGYLGGLWMGNYLDSIEYKKDLNVVCVSLMSDPLIQRYTGFEQGLKDKGYTVNLINTVGDLTREKSMADSEDMLTAHDDIDIFYGTAGTSALGAYDATQNMNRTEVMVIGFDGEDEEIQHIDEGGNYVCTICQDPVGESEVTVEAIKTVLGGGTVEGGHETPAKVYGTGTGYVTSDELLK